MKSGYPYSGRPWERFQELPEVNPYEGFGRFVGAGEGCWELIHDKIRNNCTADLLAAGQLLKGKTSRSGSHGSPGGIGLDEQSVWISFFDGGVGVEVQIGEDELTNRPEGWQRTTIRGALAFRCLLTLLGFDWIEEKLTGEDTPPSRQKVKEIVEERLTGP
ncbi:hypothetical protein N8580_03705 [Akkermansiaceae bacterium]|nr:hypothetical protein [Akkermansiaceae bacterium]MDC0323389.1 hypothetical protein [Akkermansiaceae bacterium]